MPALSSDSSSTLLSTTSTMLDIQEFRLQGPTEDGGLTILCKRCRPSGINTTERERKGQIALLLSHGVGQRTYLLHHRALIFDIQRSLQPSHNSDKESWFPTLETLFSIQASSESPSNNSNSKIHRTIGEAWVLDCPNHGQSGIYNEQAWANRPEGCCT